jgi:D-glycero-D-manno-heptose 1,7-bisphosphate phosphatase
MNKAVFLDRDGTLIAAGNNGPVNKPEHMVLLPGVVEGLHRLRKAGYLLIVVTNQGGIEMMHTTEEQVDEMHVALNEMLAASNSRVFIDAFFKCPHYIQPCDCRKPKPGMLTAAGKLFCLDMAKSRMIGDDIRDMRAAKNAGVGQWVLVKADRHKPEWNAEVEVVENFMEAVDRIIQ